MLWRFANGIDDSVVHVEQTGAKGIGNSTTLGEDLTTVEEAKVVLRKLSESVGKRLRKAGQKAGMVSVEIKYHTFQKVSHQQQMMRPTNVDEMIYQTACELFVELWSGEPVRLLGIRTAKLVEEEEPEQMTIFDLQPEQMEKQRRLREAMNVIRQKYGEGAVVKGFRDQ